jgi:spermidine synthase
VIEVGKTFFPNTLSTAFNDPRLNLIIADASKYVEDYYHQHIENTNDKKYFDAIICDSSDPVGPADVLFQPAFFQSLARILNPVGGVLTTQGECIYLHLDLIERVIKNMRENKLFNSVKYGYTMIPTYPSGQIGFMVGTLDSNVDVAGKYV